MISNNQYNKLREAISLAKTPGGCHYVINGKPACVIAQLFTLEGVTVEQLSQLEGMPIADMSDHDMGPLKSYPRKLLADLQEVWDKGRGSEEDLKNTMREMVEMEYSL